MANAIPSHSLSDSRRMFAYVFKFSKDRELPMIDLPGRHEKYGHRDTRMLRTRSS